MKRFFSVRGTLAAAACITCLSAGVWAQDSEEPSSLGDVARQTRSQVATAAESKASKAQALVDEMQQEQEAAESAPTGFVNYNAGDYRLFVPFPFSLEGRENGGAVLLGSRLGASNTEVMAGTPMPIPADLSDKDLSDTARQLARAYSQSASCYAIKLGSHKAFRCGLNKAFLLGREVSGSMEYVVASNSLIPVMCVSADDMRKCVTRSALGYQTCGNIYPTWEEVQKTKAAKQTQFHDQLSNAQVCDQIIYPSIQLKEDIVVHPVTIPEGKAPAAAGSAPEDRSVVAATPGSTSQGQSSQTPSSTGPSLAELARQTRQAARGKPQAAIDNAEGTSMAPAGFESFVLQYCLNPQQCSEASILIPEKAEVVSRTNGQHIFKAVLDGEPIILYAGPADVNAPYRSLTDADYIRMRDLANSNGWSREKPDSVSTQDLTIDGKAALMTRFRYQRDQKHWWIGERVLIDNRGSQFLLGCTAPEEHFADAEVLCTTLVNSLRLP
ncbi:MAG TPA: hypothetical protein VK812_08210 [Candidatus Binatus sp.]|nr:hypothetical protein [Candidatus Binatus sp.]